MNIIAHKWMVEKTCKTLRTQNFCIKPWRSLKKATTNKSVSTIKSYYHDKEKYNLAVSININVFCNDAYE